MKKRKGFITKNSTGSAFSSSFENESTSDSYSEDDSNYEAE